MDAIKWILAINPIKDNEYANPGKVGWFLLFVEGMYMLLTKSVLHVFLTGTNCTFILYSLIKFLFY